MSDSLLPRAAPLIFVLIWSTGWIVAKYAAPHADPLTFLVVRYACATLVIGGFAALMGAARPRSKGELGHMLLSGVLMHAVYLGGVWWAIAHGVPAGISALIAAIQPLLATALAHPLAGETVSARRWAGVALGLVGIAVVLEPKLALVDFTRLDGLALPLAVNVVAMVAVTLGAFHQKARLPDTDLRRLAAWQFAGAFLVTLPAAVALEPMRFELVPETVYALAWSVLVLSVVAIALLLTLIRRGSVARVSALIYLVPPTAAIEAWLMFDETLSMLQIAGMGIVAIGVYLATRPEGAVMVVPPPRID